MTDLLADIHEQLARDALERWTREIEEAGFYSDVAITRRNWAYGAYVVLPYESDLAAAFRRLALPELEQRASSN